MFKAILLSQTEDKLTRAELLDLDESRLPDRDVTVAVEYSTLNFKDALAITGRGAIVRSWPLVPGIDLAGTVETSRSAEWKPGDKVVVTGWGLGENHWGGLAQKARLDAGWLLRIPAPFTTRSAMSIATAGFTAALCVMALQRHGIKPGDGEVLVTGSAGGVGSVAVALLAGLGYTVVASTGRPQESDYLRGLGAARIVDRHTLSQAGKPLQKEVWAGVVDTRGQPHAGQRLRADALLWRGVGLRPGAGRRLSDHGDAVHPARRHAVRHQQRAGAQRAAPRGLGADGALPRRQEAAGDDGGDRPVGGHRLRAASARRPGARSHGGRHAALAGMTGDDALDGADRIVAA